MSWRRCRTTVPFRLLIVSALSLGRGAAAQSDLPDAGTGYPDNLISDYLDSSSDGLTSVEVPGTAAPSVTSVDVATPAAAPGAAPKHAEWLVVPIPNYSPTLGFMITGMAAYIFPADAASPPSTAGAFAHPQPAVGARLQGGHQTSQTSRASTSRTCFPRAVSEPGSRWPERVTFYLSVGEAF